MPNLPKVPDMSSVASAFGAGGGEDKEGMSTLFHVEIPGFRDMTFKSCEGIESEIEVNTLFDGGSLDAPRTVRGLHRVNKISFGKGTVGKKAAQRPLSDWYDEVCDPSKPLEKQKLSITVTDKDEKVLAEWVIKNAWPCRWMAPLMSTEVSGLTVEYVCFAHEGIERKTK